MYAVLMETVNKTVNIRLYVRWNLVKNENKSIYIF